MAKNLEMAILIDTYAAVLTEKQREMLELYYYEDLSLAEIAQNSGISRQGVRDAIKRGEAVILDFEASLGFAKRQKALLAMRDCIHAQTREIELHNDKFGYSEAIGQAVHAIVKALAVVDE